MARTESRLVYSTEVGRICPGCNKLASKRTCKRTNSKHPANVIIDGIIRIRREVKGRNGKTVTTISGFEKADRVDDPC